MGQDEQWVWSHLDRPELGVANAISATIRKEEWHTSNRLTSVRTGPTLFLASDYGGEHKGAYYETLSFLLIDLQYAWLWKELVAELRADELPQGRRMSYKSLNDKTRRRALVPFLRYANTLPGLLATFALDAGAVELMSQALPRQDELPVGVVSNWSRDSFQKLSRVAELGAMLVAGMSAPGQDLIWVSDDDAIAPNTEKLFEATRVLGHYLNHFLRHNIGHIRFGLTGTVDSGDRQVEDLVSLADLSAGAVGEMLTQFRRDVGTGPARIVMPGSRRVPAKVRLLALWLAENQHPLKKLIAVVEGRGRSFNIKIVGLYPESDGGSSFDWRGDAERRLNGRILLP